ncbi:hypothetical protein [Nocardia asteroides]
MTHQRFSLPPAVVVLSRHEVIEWAGLTGDTARHHMTDFDGRGPIVHGHLLVSKIPVITEVPTLQIRRLVCRFFLPVFATDVIEYHTTIFPEPEEQTLGFRVQLRSGDPGGSDRARFHGELTVVGRPFSSVVDSLRGMP